MAIDGSTAKVCALHHLFICWLAGNNDLLVSMTPRRLSCLSTCKSLLYGQMLDIYNEENHSIRYIAYIAQMRYMNKGLFDTAQ